MVNVLMLFPKSADLKAVDDFSPTDDSIKQAHGFRSLKQSEGDIMSPMGPPPYSKIIEISFDSLGDVMAYGQSPKAQSGKEYLKSLGAIMLIYEESAA